MATEPLSSHFPQTQVITTSVTSAAAQSDPFSRTMMSGCGCRISQQLREYNPRQLGICSFNASRYRCLNHSGAPAPLRRFSSGYNDGPRSKRFLSFKLGANASYSSFSSSSVSDDSGDLARVSYFDSDNCGQDMSEVPSVSHCPSPTDNGRIHPTEEVTSVAGGIVALGKFDALHIGHRELAIQASKIGLPYLLSFVGMAEVLGWESRPPIVAKCDRKRVLSSWASLCGNIIPKEYHVEFSKVRHLTPQQFVEKLSDELGVQGVVAGQNYRFGYKAVGTASDLERLCKDYGMEACIIKCVMDKNQESAEKDTSNSREQGQVSSTRVRYALSQGNMKYVSQLLGRHHRLVLNVNGEGKFSRDRKQLSARRSCLLNLAPREGLYTDCWLVAGNEKTVPCRVILDTTDIHLELDELVPHVSDSPQSSQVLSIEFGDSKAYGD
ncbi:FAD synthetase 1, chloroplastic-like [Andrographis paniculata]|uniref:FAD synthetase 1, chloroplastic-like n=1 Tax=Andrographis paniculata TaxID=175694 RepID=UPI0021E765C9|nr:FAD synthetase 1, chloroplastic-like [Andrographis paniculata]